MTIQWGKVLVFVNLVLAIGVAGWSFGLYTGRIDWSNKPPRGELAKRQATVKEMWNTLASAEGRQRASLRTLQTLEALGPVHQAFYKAEMDHLQSGANAASPARMVAYQNGRIAINQNGTPQMVPAKDKNGQPLLSVAHYETELKNTRDATAEAIKRYQDLVKEDTRLLELIVGEKGLRQQLFNEEQVKQARIKEEIEDLKPVYVNVLVESQLLLKRQKALRARLEQLKELATETTRR